MYCACMYLHLRAHVSCHLTSWPCAKVKRLRILGNLIACSVTNAMTGEHSCVAHVVYTWDDPAALEFMVLLLSCNEVASV